MGKLIIGFGCKRQSGKDTAAQMLYHLLHQHEIMCRKDSFAYTLKLACQIIFGFTEEQVETAEGKETVDPFWGFTPRWALQIVATEALRRNVREDIWIKIVERRHLMFNEVTILTDLRFENEARFIQQMGGILIRIDRDVKQEEGVDSHTSETALDGFDEWNHVIDNNGSINNLRTAVDNVFFESILPAIHRLETGKEQEGEGS